MELIDYENYWLKTLLVVKRISNSSSCYKSIIYKVFVPVFNYL
jgi:hypothetical protein